MAHIERLTVVFPEPMAAQIRAAVEAGDYASTSEAVRDAVRLWSDRRQMRPRP
ncbi:ribbon-helix-helix domain-containing protein [Methylobacterium currus]|uniref:ribbon-helix-helix domain-containing protein n=1 Tax=Methylobacterium currus TaxID=2051553 RepID=UPI001FD1AA9C|nr:ribbon-helix-helix domain-containing protein [Methylobacterium currus]